MGRTYRRRAGASARFRSRGQAVVVGCGLAAVLAVAVAPVESSARPDFAAMEPEPAFGVVDLHADTVYHAVRFGRSIVRGSAAGDLDVGRMRAGGYHAQVFAIWVPGKVDAAGGALASGIWAEKAYVAFKRLVGTGGPEIAHPLNLDELAGIRARGEIAAVLSMEGAHPLGDDPAALDPWTGRGLRMLGLTWNNSNAFAESSADLRPEAPGLTAAGRGLVARAEASGVLVDISHASRRTVSDVLEMATRPVVASHSSAFALRPHHRNLTDAELRGIAATGGVIGVNFHAPFLKKGGATLSDVADHIEHMVKVAGPDHVGLGSDFDGMIKKPVGLEGAEKMPLLAAELRRRGFSEGDVAKVMGANAWRVLTAP